MTIETIKQHSLAVLIIAAALVFSANLVLADTATTTVTVTNAPPTLTGLNFNAGADITLVENADVTAYATATVTDTNGCSTLTGFTGKVYNDATNSAGSPCTSNDNSCYVKSCTQVAGSCTGGADTTAVYVCEFNLWYIANPTDPGSANATDIWVFAATSTDGIDNGTATNSTETVEINSLLALDVTALIPYGSLAPGTDTAAVNQTAVITNTGNAPQDDELSSSQADGLCTDYGTCAGDTIAPEDQEYSLTSFTYGAGTDLTAVAAEVETNLAKATATTTPSTDDTFWGIQIQSGQAPGSYTGQNTFTAKVED